MTLDFLTFPDARHVTNTPCYSSREDQDPLTWGVFIPSIPSFSVPPSPPCCHVYWCTSHIDFVTLFLCLSLFPHRSVFYFLIPLYFASAITIFVHHFVLWNPFFWSLPTITWPPFALICSHTSSIDTFSVHVMLYLAWIGHFLHHSHPSHRSLNGLSSTTISPCSHSSFPFPLFLSR